MTHRLKIAYTQYKVYHLEDKITCERLDEIIVDIADEVIYPWTYDAFGIGPSRDAIRIYTTHEMLSEVKKSIYFQHIETLPLEARLADNEIGAYKIIRFFDDLQSRLKKKSVTLPHTTETKE